MPQPPRLIVSEPNPLVRVQRLLLQRALTRRAPRIAESNASASDASFGSRDVLAVDIAVDVAEFELGTGFEVGAGRGEEGRTRGREKTVSFESNRTRGEAKRAVELNDELTQSH